MRKGTRQFFIVLAVPRPRTGARLPIRSWAFRGKRLPSPARHSPTAPPLPNPHCSLSQVCGTFRFCAGEVDLGVVRAAIRPLRSAAGASGAPGHSCPWGHVSLLTGTFRTERCRGWSGTRSVRPWPLTSYGLGSLIARVSK